MSPGGYGERSGDDGDEDADGFDEPDVGLGAGDGEEAAEVQQRPQAGYGEVGGLGPGEVEQGARHRTSNFAAEILRGKRGRAETRKRVQRSIRPFAFGSGTGAGSVAAIRAAL